jgi:putative spermidine/putrescine transport system permease protein
MNGVSIHWFFALFGEQLVGDFKAAFLRSLQLGVIVMVVTVVVSVLAGLAFRKKFFGSTLLFYITVASLIVPSILISLGIGLLYNLMEWEAAWYSSGMGAHLTWTLPFGFLIMIAVFNRFDKSYEEAAKDLGASNWQTIRYVVLPIIAPSLIGVALFGFTLSYDEFARTLMTSGVKNTLPLEIFGMTTNVTTPTLYALGTLTTVFSLVVILTAMGILFYMRKHRERFGSDAGKGV